MNVFVINSGSSSIKYHLIQMPEAKIICSGLIDRIGQKESVIHHKTFPGGTEQIREESLAIKDHAVGLEEAAKLLSDKTIGVIKNPDAIDVVGHRVVHGGESFSNTMIITQEV